MRLAGRNRRGSCLNGNGKWTYGRTDGGTDSRIEMRKKGKKKNKKKINKPVHSGLNLYEIDAFILYKKPISHEQRSERSEQASERVSAVERASEWPSNQ